MRTLDLGCGTDKRPGSIGLDKIPTPVTDIVRDFAKRGIPFEDNSLDGVYAFDVIEHIEDYEDLIFVFNEIYRVLKPEGFFEFTTPQGTKGLIHLPHHRTFWIESFDYLKINDEPEYEHMRKTDGITCNFEISFLPGDEGWIHGMFKAIK